MSHSIFCLIKKLLSCPKYENFYANKKRRDKVVGIAGAGASIVVVFYVFTHFPQNVSERRRFTTFLFLPSCLFFRGRRINRLVGFMTLLVFLCSSLVVWIIFESLGFHVILDSISIHMVTTTKSVSRFSIECSCGGGADAMKCAKNLSTTISLPTLFRRQPANDFISQLFRQRGNVLMEKLLARVKIEHKVTFTSMPVSFRKRSSFNYWFSPSFSFIYERVDNCQVQPDEVSKVLQTSFLSLFKHPKNHSSTLHNAWGCCSNN